MKRLVSVIIPTFNRSAALIRALESVKSQDYSPVEIILIDDGSTDDTPSEVKTWKIDNQNSLLSIEYIQKENGGPSSCRNIGIHKARGQYIYFLDSDDYMHPNLLTDAVRELEKESADCVMFGFNTESPYRQKGSWIPPSQAPMKSFFQNSLWGYTSSSLKRIDLVRKAGLWNEKISIA